MYNSTQIKTALRSLLGFRQWLDPAKETLKTLTQTDSGLYYQGGHQLVNLHVLEALAENFTQYSYTAWSGLTAYEAGDIVTDGGNLFICILAHTNQATNNTTYWSPFYPFEEILKDWIDEATMDVVSDWFVKKSGFRTASNLLEREQLFRAREVDLTARSSGKFNGLLLKLADSNSLQIRTHKIGLWLSEAQTINIKVFKTGIAAPISDVNYVYTTANEIQWFDLDLELESKHEYRIGYETISGGYLEWIYNEEMKKNRFFEITGFEKASAGNSDAQWDTRDDIENYSRSYGINLKLSAVCDYTELITEQKLLFASAIQKRFAINTLKRILHNPNANIDRHIKSHSREFLLFEIQGNTTENNRSLETKYEQELEAITIDTRKIDKICLPCHNKGVNYRSI